MKAQTLKFIARTALNHLTKDQRDVIITAIKEIEKSIPDFFAPCHCYSNAQMISNVPFHP